MHNSAVTLLDATAAAYPANVAIEDNGVSVTYEQWRTSALNLGTALLKKIPGPGGESIPIAVFMPKSYRSLVAFMGVLYSGNVYTPLDEGMPAVRLANVLANLSPAFVVTVETCVDTLKLAGVPPAQILLYNELAEAPAEQDLINAALANVIDTDPIYIIYTSGSTGIPKGVVITHRGVVDYAYWVKETFNLGTGTVMGNQSPFYFDNSILDIYGGLLAGAKIVLIPEVFFNFPVKLPAYINEAGINFIFWVPTAMIHVANSGALDDCPMPKLEKALFCGEAMPNKPLNIWRRTHPNVLYANLYGPTEITDVCTYYIVDRPFDDTEPLPIGKPCKNMGTLILTETDKPAAVDEIGELCILGTGLALGYYKAPDLTERAFPQTPLHRDYHERIYRTGDLVREDKDGFIFFVGRKDSQIKHKGHRIELGDIETAAKGIACVQNACVLYDESAQDIVLFAESSKGTIAKDITKQLKTQLPKYMLPTKINLMAKLPLTPNGKIDRVSLRLSLKTE